MFWFVFCFRFIFALSGILVVGPAPAWWGDQRDQRGHDRQDQGQQGPQEVDGGEERGDAGQSSFFLSAGWKEKEGKNASKIKQIISWKSSFAVLTIIIQLFM